MKRENEWQTSFVCIASRSLWILLELNGMYYNPHATRWQAETPEINAPNQGASTG